MVGVMSEELDRRLVAVMFTDMVGYTALHPGGRASGRREARQRYVAALDRQHDAFGGTIVQRLGDGSMSMFPSSLAAVAGRGRDAAGARARRTSRFESASTSARWSSSPSGSRARRSTSPPGSNRSPCPARVMLSDAAYDQIKNRSDVDVVAARAIQAEERRSAVRALRRLGRRHRRPGSRRAGGKGRAAVASLPSNLPDPATSLVGRADDLAALVELAREHRVVTITGPGGVGKTRIVVRARPRGSRPSSWTVSRSSPMADITEADGLPAGPRRGARREGGRGADARRGHHRADRRQKGAPAPGQPRADRRRRSRGRPARRALPGAPDRHDQQDAARIAAEREYPLAPLEIDSAVALFVGARGGGEPGVRADRRREPSAAICRRLDGLPLALELAAARLRLLVAGRPARAARPRARRAHLRSS